MKKVWIALTVLMFTALIYSCKKQDAAVPQAPQSPQELAAQLYQKDHFIHFSANFLKDFYQFTDYLRVPAQQKNRSVFMAALKEATADESALDRHLQQYGLSLDEWIIKKNKLDNDFLQLFLQVPELKGFSDDEVMQIIKEAIQLGMNSKDQRWDEVRNVSLAVRSHATVGVMQSGGTTTVPMVMDGIEVWDCLRDAVGLGAASLIGIGALRKLAGQGVQKIVVSMSKFLAKHAGWIGLGIMLIDFSTCLYHEYQD
jgi:hypothetical protein